VTADPANVAHVFTANFGNYPKGKEFGELFGVLGDGIFNADGESWAFQRRKAHALLSDARFRAGVAARTSRKLRDGLVPLLDGLAASGAAVDLQDVFVRLTFDLTAMFVFGIDPGCLAPDFPYVPFAAAMDAIEEVLFYRHVTPVPWLRLQKWLKIGHSKKMRNARRVHRRVHLAPARARCRGRVHRRGRRSRPSHVVPGVPGRDRHVRRRVRPVLARHHV